MKALNQVQRDRAPLHQQLLILIPMIKALEDWREKQPMSLPPLTVDIQYHRGGALTLELNKTHIENDGRIVPDLTLSLYTTNHCRKPLEHEHTFITAWSYLSQNLPMNSLEYEALYKAFFLSWHVHMFEYKENIKALGLA